MRRIIIIVIILSILTGCTTISGLEKIGQSWIGYHKDHLIMEWGPPTYYYRMDNGSTIIEYRKTQDFEIFGSVFTGQRYFRFLADSYGNITECKYFSNL